MHAATIVRFFHFSRRAFANTEGGEGGPSSVFRTSSKWDTDWDRRGDRRVESTDRVPVRFLMFIRAGQPLDPGSSEPKGLSELGEKQAEITGSRLKDLGYPVPFIYHSGMADGIQTASIIGEKLKTCNASIKLYKDPLLNENVAYPPDPPFNRYSDKMYFQNTPMAEAAFRKYFFRPEGKTSEMRLEVFVGHGNLIRYMICRALQLSASGWSRFAAAHCSISTVIIQGDSKVFLNSFGEIGHLPFDHVTGY